MNVPLLVPSLTHGSLAPTSVATLAKYNLPATTPMAYKPFDIGCTAVVTCDVPPEVPSVFHKKVVEELIAMKYPTPLMIGMRQLRSPKLLPGVKPLVAPTAASTSIVVPALVRSDTHISTPFAEVLPINTTWLPRVVSPPRQPEVTPAYTSFTNVKFAVFAAAVVSTVRNSAPFVTSVAHTTRVFPTLVMFVA